MNMYRVDRNNSKTVPCGMNSILYMSDNLVEARKRFELALTGFDCWGKVDHSYGIVLSQWTGSDYKIIATKGIV